MTEPQIEMNLREVEDKLNTKYSRLSKVFFLLGFLLFIWAAVVYLVAILYDYGYNWALFSVDIWVIIALIFIALFLILEIAFYLHYIDIRNKRIVMDKPGSEFVDGKRVLIYTHPAGMEGGIFSKTYISVDDHNVLRLRTLMIPPEELWSNKE